MYWYHWIAIISLIFSVALFSYQFTRLIILGRPKDLSVSSGSVTKGVAYSFTKAMSPVVKESAYLHMPTYAAGIIYHLGTFLSILLFLVLISGFSALIDSVSLLFSIFLFISFIAGCAIFISIHLFYLVAVGENKTSSLLLFCQISPWFFLRMEGNLATKIGIVCKK